MSKNFKGKALYCPNGKASEYSKWACNFYVGCSNDCTYCYLKKGRGAKVLGGDKPTLKKCFKDEIHAMAVFEKELLENLDEIREHGLFFSFSTDPMIKETHDLTIEAIDCCQFYNVPVKILTKTVDYLYKFTPPLMKKWDRSIIAIGFTLTGHDELELNASTNEQRIYAMSELKSEGYKTFASIEPIIDFESAMAMIIQTIDFCDLYKIGLESGTSYNSDDARNFVSWLYVLNKPKIYMKENLQKLVGMTNRDNGYYFVERDYNLFK